MTVKSHLKVVFGVLPDSRSVRIRIGKGILEKVRSLYRINFIKVLCNFYIRIVTFISHDP